MAKSGSYDPSLDPTEVSLDPVLTQAVQSPSPAQELQTSIAEARRAKTLAMQLASGPTIRQRTQSEIIDLSLFANRHGNPFSIRWIPFSDLRDMTTDLMLAFGWWITMAPILRAGWAIESPNAQLAAAVDEALRPVVTSDLMAMSNMLWFGHQPLVKQFKLGQLGSTYRDSTGNVDDDIPVWTSSAAALLWKPMTVLNPSHCLPTWDTNGEMVGFKFSNTPIPHFDLISAASAYGYEVIPGHEIDGDYAIWAVNEQELNFGSCFGSARTTRAYPYWWSYWYRWRLADRSWENLADPAKYVYYPVEFDQFLDPDDPDQENPAIQQARATAIAIGESIRSGATAAFPGTFAMGDDGKVTNQRKWEAGYYKAPNNFTELDATFKELDVMKLRCVTADTVVERFGHPTPIAELEPGNTVWTWNLKRHRFDLREVQGVMMTMKDQQTYRVTLSTGKSFRATATHPVLMAEFLSWRIVDQLCVGDMLFGFQHPGEPGQLSESWVGVAAIEEDAIEDVWDIQVEGTHNFVSNGVILHNSWFTPEQSVISGTGGRSAGGSSSGGGGARMATALSDVQEQSQQGLLDHFDSYINDHKIPQFIAANFPEFVGTPCKKVSRALGAVDDQTFAQVLTLVGQVRGEVLPVDIRAVLKQKGIPMLNQAQMTQEIKEISKLQALMGPPPGAGGPVGTQGYNAGVGANPDGSTFYYQSGDRITLAESDGFMNSLPDTPHFRDAGTRSALVRLRRLFLDRYEQQYKSFADFLDSQATLHLAQNGNKQKSGLDSTQAKASAVAVVAAWAAANAPGSVGAPGIVAGTPGIGQDSAQLVTKIALAGGHSSLKGARLDAEDFGAGALEPWVQDRVKFDLDSVDSTVTGEVRDWLTGELEASVDPATVSTAAREHFSDFPATHADRVARTVTTEAFNQGTAQALHLAGVSQVQLHDASDGTDTKTDASCLQRNGKIVSTAAAMKEHTNHPNCTLYMTALATEKLSIKRVSALPEHLAREGASVGYDTKTETLYLTESVPEDQERTFLLMIGQQLQMV